MSRGGRGKFNEGTDADFPGPNSFIPALNSTFPGPLSVMFPPSILHRSPRGGEQDVLGRRDLRTIPVVLATLTALSAVIFVAACWLCVFTLPVAACQLDPGLGVRLAAGSAPCRR